MTCDPQRATCKLDSPKKKNHGPFGEATILATNNRSIEPRCEVSVGQNKSFQSLGGGGLKMAAV